MKTTAMHIHLKDIQIYAYHGVLPQERIIGSFFYININIKTDFSLAAQTDQIKDTINYADLYEIVKHEMRIPSQLLEHVCQRIAERLFHYYPTIEEIDIELNKENPPIIGAYGKNIGVSAHYIR